MGQFSGEFAKAVAACWNDIAQIKPGNNNDTLVQDAIADLKHAVRSYTDIPLDPEVATDNLPHHTTPARARSMAQSLIAFPDTMADRLRDGMSLSSLHVAFLSSARIVLHHQKQPDEPCEGTELIEEMLAAARAEKDKDIPLPKDQSQTPSPDA